MKGTLFLIPNTIAEDTSHLVIPAQVATSIKHIQIFLAEDIRTARRYLSGLKLFDSIEALHFEKLDKHTEPIELLDLLNPLLEGKDIGVISESGCPGIADPGAQAVKLAHEFGCRVKPLVGPSSIVLALMASGLNGQSFAFAGYLPVDDKNLITAIKESETESRKKNQTQIFIETPYRNARLFDYLLKYCKPETLLCIASDITGENELIKTATIKNWKSNKIKLEKHPCVFLILAQ
jgi:16S rRNA (cytidine1402-2'-O)-methyltransferase